jgi:hypothetical protein
LLVLGCLVLFAGVYRRRYPVPRAWWAAGAAAAIAAYLPWLTSGVVGNALRSSKTTAAASLPEFGVDIWSGPVALNWFNNGFWSGPVSAAPMWTFLAGGVLFTAPALWAVRPEKGREARLLPALLWILPFAGILAVGLLDVQYFIRYVLFCAAPYYVLVARGLQDLRAPALRGLLVAAILIYSLPPLRAYYSTPFKGRHREAFAYLRSGYRPGDCCAVQSKSGRNTVPTEWYAYDTNYGGLKLTDFDAIITGQAPCDRVWLIWRSVIAGPPDHDVEAEVQRRLEHRYRRAEERRYPRLSVGLYVRR